MESVRDFFTKGPLGKALLILAVVVVAGFMSWKAVHSTTENSGFKPTTITPAQQTADIENSVKQVESNPRLPEETKQGIIAMLRSHESGKTASSNSAPQ